MIPALVEEGDAILGDAKNHASLIDGCRLSKATRFVYPHCDCDALETMLRETGGFRRRLIVTDTLFSMDGDLAPLARLAELAEQYDAMLMLDEAHATGVFGAHGRGVAEQSTSAFSARSHRGLTGKQPYDSHMPRTAVSGHSHQHIRIGTLSKALGSGGGFVCGTQSLIDWLANRARTYVFSTAQPPATQRRRHRRARHRPTRAPPPPATSRRAADLRSRLRAQGWNTGHSESQIIPLIIGDAGRTMPLAASLRDAGFFIPGDSPPIGPRRRIAAAT